MTFHNSQGDGLLPKTSFYLQSWHCDTRVNYVESWTFDDFLLYPCKAKSLFDSVFVEDYTTYRFIFVYRDNTSTRLPNYLSGDQIDIRVYIRPSVRTSVDLWLGWTPNLVSRPRKRSRQRDLPGMDNSRECQSKLKYSSVGLLRYLANVYNWRFIRLKVRETVVKKVKSI